MVIAEELLGIAKNNQAGRQQNRENLVSVYRCDFTHVT